MTTKIRWDGPAGPDTALVTVDRAPSGLDGGVCVFASVKFQSGPIQEHGVNGCQVEDLLRVCRERLEKLDLILYSEENNLALTYLGKAHEALQRRTADREARGVEGTSKP